MIDILKNSLLQINHRKAIDAHSSNGETLNAKAVIEKLLFDEYYVTLNEHFAFGNRNNSIYSTISELQKKYIDKKIIVCSCASAVATRRPRGPCPSNEMTSFKSN